MHINEKTRNYLLIGAGALVAAFIVDDRIKPLGLAKINPLTIWRLRNVSQAQQQAQTRTAAAPQLAPAPPTMPRYATTNASAAFSRRAAFTQV